MSRIPGGRGALWVAAWLAVVTAACNNSEVTGLGPEFNAAQLAVLIEDVRESASGNVAVAHLPEVGEVLYWASREEAAFSLRSRDLTVPSAEPLPRLRARRAIEGLVRDFQAPSLRAALAAGQVSLIPDSLLGKTFVRRLLAGYVIDEDLDGAPPDGVRFFTYRLDPVTGRPKNVPQDLVGYLDVFDESGDTPRLALRAARKSGDRQTIADLWVEGALVFNDVELVSDFASAGFLVGDGRVDYSLSEHLALTDGFTRLEMGFGRDVSIPERGLSASVFFGGELTSDPNAPGSLRLTLSLAEGSNSVVLDASLDDITVEGSLTYNGETVMVLVGDPIYPTYLMPDGTLANPQDFAAFDRIWIAADELLLFGDEVVAGLAPLFDAEVETDL